MEQNNTFHQTSAALRNWNGSQIELLHCKNTKNIYGNNNNNSRINNDVDDNNNNNNNFNALNKHDDD